MALFEVEKNSKVAKYTKKVVRPQYAPSGIAPSIESLVDYRQYGKLMKSINESSVSDEEKKFLKFAATRHIVFNYAKIADYYAHATPEMQRLMEESALVILDFDDAMMYGYIKLTKDVKRLLDDSGVPVRCDDE